MQPYGQPAVQYTQQPAYDQPPLRPPGQQQFYGAAPNLSKEDIKRETLRLEELVRQGKAAAIQLNKLEQEKGARAMKGRDIVGELQTKQANFEFRQDYDPAIIWDVVLMFKKPNRSVLWSQEAQDMNNVRRGIIRAIKESGLLTKKVVTEKHIFIKVSADQAVLEEKAEKMALGMKMKPTFGGGYDTFTRATKHRFAGDGSHFFNIGERLRIVQWTIETPKHDGGAGISNIDELVHERKVKAYFALHHVAKQKWLTKHWLWSFFSPQPFDEIREYFGEQFALYFKFVGFYNSFLFFVGIVGVVAAYFQYTDLAEPQRIRPWGESGWRTVRAYSYDGPGTPFYCLFLAIAVTFFLEMWKRRQASAAYAWNQVNYSYRERVRPDYKGKMRKGFWSKDGDWVPLDDIDEDAMGLPQRLIMTKCGEKDMRNVVKSWLIVVTGLVIAAAIGLSLLALRVTARRVMKRSHAAYLLGFVYWVFLQTSNAIFNPISARLTAAENHRTQSEYENSLISKRFVFQFVNTYVCFFYVAFVKQAEPVFFGRKEQCMSTIDGTPGTPPNCMQELQRVLASVYVFSVAGNMIYELVTPVALQVLFNLRLMLGTLVDENLPFKQKILALVTLGQMRGKTAARRVPRCELESFQRRHPGTLASFLELSIQFGVITLFAAAFPVAPAMLLAYNLIKFKLDVLHMLRDTQRPFHRGAATIGRWFDILKFLSTIAVIINVGIICFTSRELDEWLAARAVDHPFFVKLVLCTLAEHLVFVFRAAVEYFIKDAPTHVRVDAARARKIVQLENEKAARALAAGSVLVDDDPAAMAPTIGQEVKDDVATEEDSELEN
eukprot:tig00001365_g8361.t1